MWDGARARDSAFPCGAELRRRASAVLEEARQSPVLVALTERIVAEHRRQPGRQAPRLLAVDAAVGHLRERVEERRDEARRLRERSERAEPRAVHALG